MQPKLRLFSDGEHTYAELCGKSIGKGVTAIKYFHDTGENIRVELKLDLRYFEFLEDGYFDDAERRFAECEPPKADEQL